MDMATLRKRLSRRSLAVEITTVLILKLVLILALWQAFFSEPLDQQLTEESMQAWLLGQPASTETKGATHGQ